MTPERWAEVGRLFDAAHALGPGDRAAFLERACGSDGEIRTEVESLLASSERAASFLEEPAAVALGPAPRRVGPYEIVREIGRGGMGVVFEAVRRDQGFERSVALKLVKRGMDTDFVVRRFESERRILAALDHPNIARVLDGGSTDDGLPYFVMERIEGRSIVAYCDEEKLPVAARLALFRSVCAAVQYAHQRLVIHRDIKPGNILVTREGVPKLLDFGLAKVLAREDGEEAARTETALRILTPEYASPEQIRGDALTTATDVYSLGVVLYELLTGERPYRLVTRTAEEIGGAVLRQEPRRPSTKVPLHRDLDAIALAALRKEPARRYASAEQLGEDVRRHLDGLPVRARPDSFGYRAGKFARRHRAGLAAGALVAASLLAALGVSLHQMRLARAERDRARLESARAQETARFLADLFRGANPVETRGRTLTARDLLDRATERIGRELRGAPEVQASLFLVMADAYDRLDAFERALVLAERSIALRESRPAPHELELAESLHAAGRLRRHLGEPAKALPLLERAAALREKVLGPEHADVAVTLREEALVLDDVGRSAEARALMERAIRIQERAAPGSAALALLYSNLGNLRLKSGERAGARAAYERSIALYESTDTAESWGVAMPLLNLGTLLREDEDLDAAQPLFERALAVDEKTFGGESSSAAYTLACLGDLAHARGDLPHARALLERSLRIYSNARPPEHQDLAAPLGYLADVCLAERRPAEAVRLSERALSITERTHGAGHPDVGERLVLLGRARADAGDRARAETALRRALAIQRRTLAAGHRSLVPALTSLGGLLASDGRADEARPLLTEAVAIARSALPERHSERRAAEDALRALPGLPPR